MLPNLKGIEELLSKVKQLVAFLIVYRIGAHLPVPGLDPSSISGIFSADGSLFGLFDTFSGGALSNLSLFTLGIIPYISASIVVNLLTKMDPSFSQLLKDGASGQRKITLYTRLLTVFFGVGLGTVSAKNLAAYGAFVPTTYMMFHVVLSFVTGTMILVWMSDQITEIKLGNGSSMLIFAGIVSGLPSTVFSAVEKVRVGTLSPITFFISLALVVACIFFVVFVERAQRRVPVHYTRRGGAVGQSAQSQRSDLPLKINASGVMPVIFASSVIVTPASIFQSLGVGSENSVILFIQENIASGKPLFMLLLTIAIVGFSFFSAAMFCNPKEMADDIKKSGGVIQGIRPGTATAAYIDKVMSRLTLAGAFYLTLVALLPELMNYFGAIPFSFGGTSLLIVVVVVMDIMVQTQSHLFSAQYANILKKYQPQMKR